MTDHREVMRMALDQFLHDGVPMDPEHPKRLVVEALRAALDEPKQEPVANQPDALRLAAWLDHYGCVQEAHDAAACLRQQHALLHPTAPPADADQAIADATIYGLGITQGGKRIDPSSIWQEPTDTITVRLTREDLDDLRHAALKALSLPTERVHDLRERVLGTFPDAEGK